MATAPQLGVSIFLPTHKLGRETRQDPIRLKNLLSKARKTLLSADMPAAEADAMLAPAITLVEDYDFWQHQDQGLAAFLGGDGMQHYKLPITLPEKVVVGPGFHVKPLLPVLAADGAFHVLTITADAVRLFDASRFAMVENGAVELPHDLGEVTGDVDYENPLQASPVGRPHTASISVTNSQVCGDSPEEWRKGRIVEFVRRIAAALEAYLAPRPMPLVLVADADVQGHFRKLWAFADLLAGVVEANPGAMDREALHAAAYAVVQPLLDDDRERAVTHFSGLHGSGDARAAIGIAGIVTMARQGRVDTLLLAKGIDRWGHLDKATGETEVSEGPGAGTVDLPDLAAVLALQQGGSIYMLQPDDMPAGAEAAAVLRY